MTLTGGVREALHEAELLIILKSVQFVIGVPLAKKLIVPVGGDNVTPEIASVAVRLADPREVIVVGLAEIVSVVG